MRAEQLEEQMKEIMKEYGPEVENYSKADLTAVESQIQSLQHRITQADNQLN